MTKLTLSLPVTPLTRVVATGRESDAPAATSTRGLITVVSAPSPGPRIVVAKPGVPPASGPRVAVAKPGAPPPGPHQVVEVGADYLVLEDAGGRAEVRIPVHAVRSVTVPRDFLKGK